jgi:hypothetical protein
MKKYHLYIAALIVAFILFLHIKMNEVQYFDFEIDSFNFKLLFG